MGRILPFLFLCICLTSLSAKSLEVNIATNRAILINAETGIILYEKNAHEKAYPASITKVATALFALKLMGENLEVPLQASQKAIATITPQAKRQSNYRSPPYLLDTDGSHMSIKKGEEFPFIELLYGMLIASANDASNVIAENLGGTIPNFMQRLNVYLEQLGCKNTYFCNPHGLHHPSHETTAYDMALIAKEAFKNPRFREIVSQSHHLCPQTNLEYERKLRQTNLLMRSGSYFYPKAIGIKTGYTSKAGKTLVAAAQDKGRTLIAVILASDTSKERYEDAIHLFEAAFSEKKMRHFLIPKGLISFKRKVPHGKKHLNVFLPEGLYYDFYPAEKRNIKTHISWNLPPLPIRQGEEVGFIKVSDEAGNLVKVTPLYAAETVDPTLWYRLTHGLKERREAVFWVLAGCFLFVLLVSLKNRRQRKKTRRRLF